MGDLQRRVNDISHNWLRILSVHRWFEDRSFRRLFENVGILLSGDAVSRLFAFVSVVLTARALGTRQFGILVLVQTYALVIDRLVNFQSWQALIKYGAEAFEQDRHEDIGGLIRLGSLLDVGSAIIGTIIALSAAHWVGPLFGWDNEVTRMAGLYGLVILFNLTGTPTGIIRLLDKFKLIAIQRTVSAGIKLLAILAAYASGAGLWTYVLIWMITDIVGYVTLFFLGHLLLYRSRIRHWWHARIRDWRRFVSFVWWSNLASTLDIPVKLLDVFIVSLVISVEAVGIYKIFKQVSDILRKPVDPIYQAIYPQFAALIASAQDLRAVKMAVKVGVLILAFSIPLVGIISLSSPWWLDKIFGEAYASEWAVFSLYLLLQGISIVFVSIHPLFIAMGYIQKNFWILGLANGSFLVFCWFLGKSYGLWGIVTAYGVQFSTVVVLKVFLIRQRISRYLAMQPESVDGRADENTNRE